VTAKIGKLEQQSNSSFDFDFNALQEIENSNSNNKKTTKEQQSNTNKNVKNIYLYLLNKYKAENRNNFDEYMKKIRELKKDDKWNELTREEQQKLISEI
jgi:hypothetical protein